MSRRWKWSGALLIVLVLAASSAEAAKKTQFYHTAVSEIRQGEKLELSANMPEAGGVVKVTVWLRFGKGKPFRSFVMPQNKGDYYELQRKDARIVPPALWYYITGKDAKGVSRPLFASAAKPQKVKVLPAQIRASLAEELSVFGAELQVYSASRRKQKITESPSAITVLRASDIRNTGRYALPEILRQVPGMDVLMITKADANLSVRGLNREGANKLLTLLDGRSVYIDLFGITFWEALPISILEIERIEVIRGPGSSLYGANAFGGVVNIFTTPPEKLKGFRYLFQAGPDGIYSTFVGGHRIGKSAYRISTTYNSQRSFESDEDGFESVKGHAVWSYTFQKKRKLTFSGGFSRDRASRIQTLFGSFRVQATQGFAKANLQLDGFRLQIFWSGLDADLNLGFPLPESLPLSNEPNAPRITLKDIGIARFGPEQLTFQAHTIDIEPQYVLEAWQGRERLVVGGNFRANISHSDQLKIQDTLQLLGSVFAQNELKPTNWFIVTVAGRFDFLYTDIENYDLLYSPSANGALIFKPHPDHTIRLNAGLAFRYPAFLEYGLQLELVPGKTLSGGKEIPALEFRGESKLKPEQLFSLEAGYAGRLFKRILINVDFAYQRFTDLILFDGDVNAIVNYFVIYAGLSNKEPSTAFTFNNDISAWSISIEASLRFLITDWLQGFVNYTFQRIAISDIKNADLSKLCQPGQKCPPLIDEDTPQHKLNFGINLNYKRLSVNLFGHYVHRTRRINFLTRLPNAQVTNPLTGKETSLKDLSTAEVYNTIPSYFLLNLNAAIGIWDKKIEVGFSIYNLIGLVSGGFGQIENNGFARDAQGNITGVQRGYHIQYPRLDLFGSLNGGELIGGRINVFLRGKF